MDRGKKTKELKKKFQFYFFPPFYLPGGSVTVIDIFTHGVNAIYVIVNASVTSVPVRFYHFLHGILFGVTYVVFTAVYYAAGGTNHQNKPYIYPVLDWTVPGTTLAYCLAVLLVALPLGHFLFFGIYALRRCSCRQQTTSNPVWSRDIVLYIPCKSGIKCNINVYFYSFFYSCILYHMSFV